MSALFQLKAVHEQLAALSQAPVNKPKRKKEKKEKEKKRKDKDKDKDKDRHKAKSEDEKKAKAAPPSKQAQQKKAPAKKANSTTTASRWAPAPAWPSTSPVLLAVGARVAEGVLRVGLCTGAASPGDSETAFTWKTGWGWWSLSHPPHGATAGTRRDLCWEDMGSRGCCSAVRGAGPVSQPLEWSHCLAETSASRSFGDIFQIWAQEFYFGGVGPWWRGLLAPHSWLAW